MPDSTTSTPASATLEKVALRWLLDALGLPAGLRRRLRHRRDDGEFHARWPPRATRCSTRAGWDVEADGLFGAPPITVVVGEEVHPTLLKSLGMLGLGRERVVRVPVDGRAACAPTRCPPSTARPSSACRRATSTPGRSTRFARDLRARARGRRLGARGWRVWTMGAAAPARAHLVAGVAEADSWATDAHKWLNVPYDSGLAFVRDADALRAAMAITRGLSAARGVRARTRQITRPSFRGARAASRSGRRCARWAAAGWPT